MMRLTLAQTGAHDSLDARDQVAGLFAVLYGPIVQNSVDFGRGLRANLDFGARENVDEDVQAEIGGLGPLVVDDSVRVEERDGHAGRRSARGSTCGALVDGLARLGGRGRTLLLARGAW